MRKGQTALEFLMTYGWAILIVAIVGAVLWQMGVFNPGRFMGSQYSGFDNLVIEDWAITGDGTVTLSLAYRESGKAINVTGAQVIDSDCKFANTANADNTPENSTDADYPGGGAYVPAGETQYIAFSDFDGAASTGDRCKIDFQINYTEVESGVSHPSTGTFRAKLG